MAASGWRAGGGGEYEWVEGGSASMTAEEAKQDEERVMWLAYAAFHLGSYQQAMDAYRSLIEKGSDDPMLHVYMGCCLERLGWHTEAEEKALQGPACPLHNRLLFHLAHRLNDENKLMMHHQKLADTTLDQLSLASIHFLRNHFQEATDIYKRLLLENRDYTALNVYVALCYYKLDYYDVSLEILAAYLQSHPDSSIALNLKACNQFRLYDGKAAEAELAPLTKEALSIDKIESKLVRHNMVVFQNGERALQILPPLVGVVPEARLNLVIYHMHNGEVQEAFELMKEIEPSSPQEYILKGVTNLAVGQAMDSREHLKVAQQYFQLLGASASECDTIPGRQCMSSCFFILRQFDDVLIYLSSIEAYFPSDPTFLYNYAIARAAAGKYKEAEPALLSLQSGPSAEELAKDYIFQMWLARCLVMNGKARQAWEIYLKMEGTQVRATSQTLAHKRRTSSHACRHAFVFAGVVCYAPAPGQRLVPRGRLPLRGQGLRHLGAARPQPRVLGRQARRVRRRLPDGHRPKGAQGDVARGHRDAQELAQPAGRVLEPRHEEMGAGA